MRGEHGMDEAASVRWSEVMEGLKTGLDVVLEAIPCGSRICFVDYPVHRNIGDLLIMQGAEAFFRANGIEVVARYSLHDCPNVLSLPSGTIVTFHGGGNFGDLYPAHQHLRERLTKDNPDRRVVMLPQTVFYRNEVATASTIACMGTHPDLHIFVRDQGSRARIAGMLPNASVALAPDMAHYLWPALYPGQVPEVYGSPLRVMRRDREAAGGVGGMDWDDLFPPIERAAIACFRKAQCTRHLPAATMAGIWTVYAGLAVAKAVRRYRPHTMVETSRLHGHILACLMGIPSVVLDNSYGKNSAYFSLWTHALPGCSLSGSQQQRLA